MAAAGISIHALREEGDGGVSTVDTFQKTFLSTPSARRATLESKGLLTKRQISIHALREEGDASDVVKSSSGEGISIHALREEGDLLLL